MSQKMNKILLNKREYEKEQQQMKKAKKPLYQEKKQDSGEKPKEPVS